jgi:hypothetical protein
MLVIDSGYGIEVLMFNPLEWRYMKTSIYSKNFQWSKDGTLAFARATMLVAKIIQHYLEECFGFEMEMLPLFHCNNKTILNAKNL